MKPIVASVALLSSLAFARASRRQARLSRGHPSSNGLRQAGPSSHGRGLAFRATARTELASLAPGGRAEADRGGAEPRRTHVSYCACYELLTMLSRKTNGRSTRSSGTDCTTKTSRSATASRFYWATLRFITPSGPSGLRSRCDGQGQRIPVRPGKVAGPAGNADVLRTLFAAVSDDSFMVRHVGNIGLKGLSGKNVEDFQGYHYAEGAFVIAGQRTRDSVRRHHRGREEG